MAEVGHGKDIEHAEAEKEDNIAHQEKGQRVAVYCPEKTAGCSSKNSQSGIGDCHAENIGN